MRAILTAVALAIASPVLLAGQSALGAGGKLLTPGASDQAASPQEPAESQPAAPSIIRPGGPPIILQSSQGALLRLPRAARTVFISDPEVADVQMSHQKDMVYVNGKKAGITVLYAADDAGQVLMNSFIEVKGGPVAIIKAGGLMIGGEPTPIPQASQTPQPTVTESTTTYSRQPGGVTTGVTRSTTTTGP